MEGFAEAADEGGEIADPCGQSGLDTFAHAARDHRRCAAGADRDDDVAAIDDGRKDEARMHEIVHHIDGQTNRLGPYRHRHADIAGAGAEDRNDTGEIGRQRIALRELDPRRVSGIKPADIMIAIGRIPADARPGRSEQAQFRPHQLAGAHEQHRAGLQIEEYRQIAHAILTSPHSGLTGIIFYICLVQRPQREIYFFSIAVQL